MIDECLLQDDLEERIGYYESLGNKDLHKIQHKKLTNHTPEMMGVIAQ